MFSSYGTLRYDPEHSKTRRDEWWLILECNTDIIRYYKYWISKHGTKTISSVDWLRSAGLPNYGSWKMTSRGVTVTESAWKSHISVIKGEEPEFKDKWQIYQGRRVKFEYDNYIETNGAHWWLRVYSRDLQVIRKELGLTPLPLAPFHITIGKDIESPPRKKPGDENISYKK